METLPKIIVLDLQKEFKHFEKAVQPFILATETTPQDLVETIWGAFFVQDDREANLDDVISNLAEDERYATGISQSNIAKPLHAFRQALEIQVTKYHLYFDRGYLPYDLKFYNENTLVLHFDAVIDNCALEGNAVIEEENAEVRKEFLNDVKSIGNSMGY